MINIKDIAELNITNLSEGILDDIDTVITNDEQFLDNQRLEKWGKKSFNKTYWRPTKKGWVIQGDFTIDDIDTLKYVGPVIKTVKGNIYITGCNIKSLEGMFAAEAVIEGGLWIESCKNLESLKGSPAKVNTLTVTFNPKLKSVEFAPEVEGNFYFERNGKKLNAENIAKIVTVKKHIFCSNTSEDPINEAFITESFKNHHFTRLAKQLKEPAYKEKGLKVTDVLFGGNHKAFDQLSNKDIQEYDSRSSQAVTVARRIFSRKIFGVILLMDSNGKYTGVMHGKTFIDLSEDALNSRWYATRGYELDQYSFEKKIEKSDTVIIINLSNIESTWKLKNDRQDARSGALAYSRGDLYVGYGGVKTPDVNLTYERDPNKINAKDLRYYQEIADANRARYKKLVNIIRAERAKKANNVAENFNKIKVRVDNLFARYTALIAKVVEDPKKYSAYDINQISSLFKSAYGGKNRFDIKVTGLLKLFEGYVSLMVSAGGGNTTDAGANIKRYEDAINAQCDKIEKYLKDAESK